MAERPKKQAQVNFCQFHRLRKANGQKNERELNQVGGARNVPMQTNPERRAQTSNMLLPQSA
jgi:hypothetical protein